MSFIRVSVLLNCACEEQGARGSDASLTRTDAGFPHGYCLLDLQLLWMPPLEDIK